MNKRMVHSSMCTSEKLGMVSADAETLYWRLYTHTDDYGNIPGGAGHAKDRAFPKKSVPEHRNNLMTYARVESALGELIKIDLVRPYFPDDSECLHFMGFWKHQTFRSDRKRTRICPLHPDDLDPESEKLGIPKSEIGIPETTVSGESGIPKQPKRYTTGIPKSENENHNLDSGIPNESNWYTKTDEVVYQNDQNGIPTQKLGDRYTKSGDLVYQNREIGIPKSRFGMAEVEVEVEVEEEAEAKARMSAHAHDPAFAAAAATESISVQEADEILDKIVKLRSKTPPEPGKPQSLSGLRAHLKRAFIKDPLEIRVWKAEIYESEKADIYARQKIEEAVRGERMKAARLNYEKACTERARNVLLSLDQDIREEIEFEARDAFKIDRYAQNLRNMVKDKIENESLMIVRERYPDEFQDIRLEEIA